MTTLFLLLSALLSTFATIQAKSGPGLPPFAITSIDVEPAEGSTDPNRVQFHALIKGKKNDTSAVILKDIVQTNRTHGGGWFGGKKHPVFEATKMSQFSFKALFPAKKILLCVHGFNVQPKSFLEQVAKHQKDFRTYLPIPVLWPCEDKGIQGYLTDRRVSVPGAAEAFASLLSLTTPLQTASVMCHSMGNFVLKSVAQNAVKSNSLSFKFENAFMVAADVRHDVFSDKYNTKNGWNVPPIVQMTKNAVYVLHSSKDKALWGRRAKNGGMKALGSDGADKKKISRTQTKSRIFNKNCNEWNINTGITAHGYQFKKESIDIYEDPKPKDE